jgi:hypothetical protein
MTLEQALSLVLGERMGPDRPSGGLLSDRELEVLSLDDYGAESQRSTLPLILELGIATEDEV